MEQNSLMHVASHGKVVAIPSKFLQYFVSLKTLVFTRKFNWPSCMRHSIYINYLEIVRLFFEKHCNKWISRPTKLWQFLFI